MDGTLEESTVIATLKRDVELLQRRIVRLERMLETEHEKLERLEHEHEHDHSVINRIEHDPCMAPRRVTVGL